MVMLKAKLNSGVCPSFEFSGKTVMIENKKNESARFKHPLKIGTQNLRTMTQTGKIDNAIQKMKMMKIEIMGVGKIMWPGLENME